MVEDVKLAVADKSPVYFLGRAGGWVPDEKIIIQKIEEILNGEDSIQKT